MNPIGCPCWCSGVQTCVQLNSDWFHFNNYHTLVNTTHFNALSCICILKSHPSLKILQWTVFSEAWSWTQDDERRIYIYITWNRLGSLLLCDLILSSCNFSQFLFKTQNENVDITVALNVQQYDMLLLSTSLIIYYSPFSGLYCLFFIV